MPWLPKAAGSTNGVPSEKAFWRRAAAVVLVVAELVRGQQVAHALHRDRGVEEAEAAADDGLVVAAGAPGEAHARAEVVLVGVDQGVRVAGLAGDERAAEVLQAGRQLGSPPPRSGRRGGRRPRS